MSNPQTISITVEIPAINMTAEALERAVVAQALATVLQTKDISWDEDGEPFVRFDDTMIKRLRAEVSDQMSKRVTALVDQTGPTLVADVLNAEFQPQTPWGEPAGKPTTIREMVYTYAKGWLDADVQPDGRPIVGYYSGPKMRRLHWMIHAEVEAFFKKEAADVVSKITAEVKPAIAQRLTAAVAESVNRILGVGR